MRSGTLFDKAIASAMGIKGGMPNIKERKMGLTRPAIRPQGHPQMKPHSSTGMCMGLSMLPICGICPVKKGSSRASAIKNAVSTMFLRRDEDIDRFLL